MKLTAAIGYQNTNKAFITRLPNGHFQWLVSTEHGQQTGIENTEGEAIDRCDEVANLPIVILTEGGNHDSAS